jgi:tetratricopeptide (TPR) repeat protein
MQWRDVATVRPWSSPVASASARADARLMRWLVLVVVGLAGCGAPPAQRPMATAGPAAGPTGTSPSRDATGSTEASGEDDELASMMLEGQRLLKAGRTEEAITRYLDKVIASYEKRYAAEKRRIYCGHGDAEVLMYMLGSANKGEPALAVSPAWADAWYLKSYALTELQRMAEARAALEKALALSPSYAPFLSELGHSFQLSRDWQRALALFQAAEESVGLISDEGSRLRQHTRALRGQGYSLIELGDLDSAEKKYRQALQLDPGDTTSKQQLEYIEDRRPQRK